MIEAHTTITHEEMKHWTGGTFGCHAEAYLLQILTGEYGLDEARRDVLSFREPTITVCSACLQASCWQGKFYCDDYQTAGTVEKTRTELAALNLEHPDNWESAPAGRASC